MFLEFFYLLRAKGLEVSINEWMILVEALDKGLAHSSLTGFYHLCRSILIKSESEYDKFDAVFAEYFKNVQTPEDLPEEFWQWLAESDHELPLDDSGRKKLPGFQRRQDTGYQTVPDGIPSPETVLVEG